MSAQSDETGQLKDEAEELNSRALGAMLGWDRNWQATLVELLRSKHPINPSVRGAFADALEGKSPSGVQLTMSGHEKSARFWSSIRDRREWYEFGALVSPVVEAAVNLPAGIEEAAERLGRSEAYCKKAYYYRRDCDEWMDRARGEGKCYANLDDKELGLEFHISSIEQATQKPTPLSGLEFDKHIANRRDALGNVADLLKLDGWQRAALITSLYWMERTPS